MTLYQTYQKEYLQVEYNPAYVRNRLAFLYLLSSHIEMLLTLGHR